MKKTEKKQHPFLRDPFDGEYVGNIWGWKNSIIGLVIILFFLGLMIYRHYTMCIPFGGSDPAEKTEIDH